MKEHKDIFFVKITQFGFNYTEGRSKYVNYNCIESIETIATADGDNAIHIVFLFNDPFRYKISDNDYERLINL